MMKALSFEPMPAHERGTVLRLLQESYRELPQISESLIGQWEDDWKRFDDDIFYYPETVGASGFITYQGESIIGFGSWDPRRYPTAIIGHNCILPPFRGKGYGKRQIQELLRRLKALRFARVGVTTGDHPSFLAAQKMYFACGFQEIRRFTDKKTADWRIVEFEKEL